MVVCGLKFTHDGCIALVDNNQLVFSIELEKIANNERYTELKETSIIETILSDWGYPIESIDHFAVDGWGGYNVDALAIQPRLELAEKFNILTCSNKGVEFSLSVAKYEERFIGNDICEEWNFCGLKVGKHNLNYSSYLHVTGHILSTYYSSPFAKRQEGSYILVWDGGMFPRLYYYDRHNLTFESLGPLFLLIGNIYTIFSQHFGPFKSNGNFAKDDLSVAGKVMAYIALGEVKSGLYSIFNDIYRDCFQTPMGFANVFANEFKKRIRTEQYSDEDILCSFHAYIGDLLVEKLRKKVSRFPKDDFNFCFAGGCALNIKWNSQIRDSGIFKQVFVSPFPNDSGSAIGAACAKSFHINKDFSLDWNVYSGPSVVVNEPCEGWARRAFSIKELAMLLHETQQPVVVLNGRAELGPRALGNRSIVASPASPCMKTILNTIKKREDYRPVSPICLEEKAVRFFTPGSCEPYMIFEHRIREEWKTVIPAICHLDGTVRLQTVNQYQNQVLYELLSEYELLSDIPVLCNTSANLHGSGFFPDIHSATLWNKVNYVWSNYTLYEKTEKISF